MRGKLIVVDGVDSSGKESQVKKLYETLIKQGKQVMHITFPDYDSMSSGLVKMYLNGDFGKNPGDVDSYIASTFYAGDRYASYKTTWGTFYEKGGIVLCDRYSTSNMVHQASKIKDIDEKNKFLDWLWDFEYVMYGLPIPDAVLFLDMPPEYGMQLMAKRKNKITGEDEKDIHESDSEYLMESYKNALYVANKYKWTQIKCVQNQSIKTIEAIAEEVLEEVLCILT